MPALPVRLILLVALAVMVLGVPAHARPPEPAGPTVGELQRAALIRARLQPERMVSLERRLRLSALLPQLRLRVGRGTGQLQTVTDYSGSTRLVVGDQNAWQFEAGATWNLDRLVFHPDETRLAREAERASTHRERLLRQIGDLHAERERLRTTLLLAPPASAVDAAEMSVRIDELTALLDSLTGLDSAGPEATRGGAQGPRSGLSWPAHAVPGRAAVLGRRPGGRTSDAGNPGEVAETAEAE